MHIKSLKELERSVKIGWRSKSLDLMFHWRQQPSQLRNFQHNGHPLYYRTGTSDLSALNEIIFRKNRKSEYFFPLKTPPPVILDIGGHIGLAAIYYAQTYPDAKIFTIEPAPDNFEILLKNTVHYPNIKGFNIGLGSRNGSFQLHGDPYNRGGYSLTAGIGNQAPLFTVEVTNVADFLSTNSIAQPDLIKIDTEGAEYDILTAFPPELLKKTTLVLGELHDKNDFELLALLSRWFHIRVKKDSIESLSAAE